MFAGCLLAALFLYYMVLFYKGKQKETDVNRSCGFKKKFIIHQKSIISYFGNTVRFYLWILFDALEIIFLHLLMWVQCALTTVINFLIIIFYSTFHCCKAACTDVSNKKMDAIIKQYVELYVVSLQRLLTQYCIKMRKK